MDFASVIRRRLEELGLGQRDLASASQVTESYISQLLSSKKIPPLPNRTDIYDKMSRFLSLPREELARLAALQHHEALDRVWKEAPPARFGPMRDLILRKCRPARQVRMRAVFHKDPFGEMERLITRTLVQAIRDLAREHARDEAWLRSIASPGRYRMTRVRLIELLDSDPIAPIGDFSAFLEPLIQSWDFDFVYFTVQVHLAGGASRRFGFHEESSEEPAVADEPALRAFLQDTLSAGVTVEEIESLRRMRFSASRKPTELFYYRALQNLRDPLHFRERRRRRTSDTRAE
jgi:transcriptional regulator with XRE-family HTH domain